MRVRGLTMTWARLKRLVLKKMMEERRQERRKMAGRAAQACLGPTWSRSGQRMTRYLSPAMAIIVRDDMKTATQGNVFTSRHSERKGGSVQDMLNPSTRVRGMDRAIMMSEIAKLKMKIFRAVRDSFLLNERYSQ